MSGWLIKRSTTVGAVLMLLSACTPAAPRVTDDSHAQLPALGELRAAANRIGASPNRWYCDDAVQAIREEVTSELDRRAAWILSGTVGNASEARARPGFRREDWREGFPIWIREDEKPEYEDRWEKGSIRSWVSLYSNFIYAKEGENLDAWADVAADARSTLLDDQERVISRKNYFLDHTAPDQVPLFRQAFVSCLADPHCLMPVLSSELNAWVQGVAWYRQGIAQIRALADQPETARSQIRSYLENRVDIDFDRFQFKAGPHVRRTSPDRWVMRLSPAGVEGLQTSIAAIIESGWRSSRYQVQVEWGSPEEHLPRIILETAPGARSYVQRDETGFPAEIHLFPDSLGETIQHEMGHVLGFRDHYYTVYSPHYCGYSDDSNSADLMSRSEKGRVLDRHWEQLKRAYPYTPTATTRRRGRVHE